MTTRDDRHLNAQTGSTNLRAALTVAIAAVVLCVAVPVAWASHLFTDVPNDHPFHSDISAIQYMGITSGKTCDPPGTPPTYCPGEAIARQGMAAFVHRGFGRVAFDVGPPTPVTAVFPQFVVLGELTIQVPGIAGGRQSVKVDAVVTTEITDATGCPCSTVTWIAGPGQVFPARYLQNEAVGGGSSRGFDTAANNIVASVTSGSRTYQIRAARITNTAGTVTAYSSLSAITAPTGSSTISGSPATLDSADRPPLVAPRN